MTDQTPPQFRLTEERERLERDNPGLAPGFRHFVDTFKAFLEVRKQFEPPADDVNKHKHDPEFVLRLR